MPRLPQVSGRALIRLLSSLGYEVIRQRGSHIRVRKISALGEHNLTVPDHAVLADGVAARCQLLRVWVVGAWLRAEELVYRGISKPPSKPGLAQIEA